MVSLPTTHHSLRTRRGFTLIELVIYMGLMSIVVGLFAAILVTIVRIQTQQTSSRQVASELNFVMNTLSRDIQNALVIETHSDWIAMITPSSSPDAVVYGLSGGAIWEQENQEVDFSPLTTNKVIVDSLAFTELSNGNTKMIRISLTLSFNTENPTQEYAQTLQTTVVPLLRSN